MKNVYIIVSLIFMFTGCSTTLPTLVKHKISPQLSLEKQKSSTCSTKSLKVSSAFTSTNLMSKDMSYVVDDSKVYEYSESAWLNNPNRSISREYVKMLRELGIYKSVQSSKSRTKTDLMLEIDIDEFMQYYSDDLKRSYSRVHLNLSIVDAQTSKVVATTSIRSQVDTKTLDADGGVKALNEALEDVLSKSAKWFIKGCK